MNYFLLVSSIAVAGAALADGISTVRFLRHGYEEQNPLFGKHPSAVRVFGEGTLLIAMEFLAAWGFNFFSLWAGYLFAAAFLVQVFVHFRNTLRNFRLPARP